MWKKWKQQSLFQDLSWTFEIKKHSSLIQMQWDASLIQRKAMNGIIYIIKDQLARNPEQRIFKTDLGILKRLSGIRRTDNSNLKKALRGLATMAIEYNILNKDKEMWWVFTFLSHAQIEVEQRWKSSLIIVECPTIVIEAIRRPAMYSKLNLMITRWISSKHALILYEVLFDYIKLGKIRIRIEELRRLFGLSENQYRGSFSMFRKRVIDRAIKEVNAKTDILVEVFEVERIWRKVLSMTFTIRPAKMYNRLEEDKENLLSKLISYWFSEKKATQIIYSHDKDYILANIAVIEEQYIGRGKTIKSIPALLTSAFKADYSQSIDKAPTIIRDKVPPSSDESDLLYNNQESEVALKEAFNLYLWQLLDERKKWLASEELEWYKERFISQLWETHIASKLMVKHGFEHRIVQSTFSRFLKQELLSLEEQDFDVYKKSTIKNVD